MAKWKILKDPGPSADGTNQPWTDTGEVYDDAAGPVDMVGDVPGHLQSLQAADGHCYAAQLLP